MVGLAVSDSHDLTTDSATKSSFVAINVEPEEDTEDEVDDSKEIQV